MKTPYRIYPTLVDAVAVLDKAAPLFLDTETCGFYQKVRLLQMYQPHLDHVVLVEWPNHYETIATLGEFHNAYHNAHYDVTTLQEQTETRWFPDKLDDTFLLARLAFPAKEKFALDDVMGYVLGYDPYDRQNLDKKKLQKSKWDVQVLTEDQLLYAATDVYYMPDIWNVVSQHIEEPSYKLDMLTLRYCLDFQWNGMPVDNERLFKLYEGNLEKIKEYNVPINVNSWQQVRPYIESEESDDLALAKLTLQGNKKAEAVRAVRKLRKQNSFLDKFDTMDGRIYGKFKPSARSGRLTSNDQNLQQLPRATKGVFGYSEDAGRVLIYADYAQLELRTICAITKCANMERLFRDGEDLHGFTAAMIFGEDWTKDQRQLSKTYNFNFLYGGGINVLIGILIKTAGVLLNEQQANRDRKRWRNLWREIFAWQERGIRNFQAGRMGATPMGRKYKAKMMTDQLNIENQGAGAEVAKLALHYLAPTLEEAKKQDAYLCNFIHDSFIIDCPNDPAIYEPLAKKLAEAMQEAWFEISKLLAIKDLPMPVNVKVGYNWGDIEDDDAEDLWSFDLEGMTMLEKVNATV